MNRESDDGATWRRPRGVGVRRRPLWPLLIAGAMVLMPAWLGADGRHAAVRPASTGTWTLTGTLTIPRAYDTATLLPTGRVLLAGGDTQIGIGGTEDIASAELYDPATGTFTPTGTMTTYRVGHTATLLANGQVLLTGGCSGLFFACVSTWASAELYNPTTGTFTTTGSMSTARQFHTATLLRNGLVLVAGGAPCSTCPPLASAELYSPLTGRWYRTGSMHLPRAYASATLLPNGDVLVAGGCLIVDGNCQAYSTLRSAEVYHLATGRWYWVGPMTVPRADQTATLLPSGQVLVAGGCSSVSMHCVPPITASAEVYTPGVAGAIVTPPTVAVRARRTVPQVATAAQPLRAPAGWQPSD